MRIWKELWVTDCRESSWIVKTEENWEKPNSKDGALKMKKKRKGKMLWDSKWYLHGLDRKL